MAIVVLRPTLSFERRRSLRYGIANDDEDDDAIRKESTTTMHGEDWNTPAAYRSDNTKPRHDDEDGPFIVIVSLRLVPAKNKENTYVHTHNISW